MRIIYFRKTLPPRPNRVACWRVWSQGGQCGLHCSGPSTRARRALNEGGVRDHNGICSHCVVLQTSLVSRKLSPYRQGKQSLERLNSLAEITELIHSGKEIGPPIPWSPSPQQRIGFGRNRKIPRACGWFNESQRQRWDGFRLRRCK